MKYQTSGVFLLKRWSQDKGVDHYAVGLAGSSAWRAGCFSAVAIQLMPDGIGAAPWTRGAGWKVLARTEDESAALMRLTGAQKVRYALVDSNCEHFARHVVTGVRESRQVQGVVAVAALVAILALAR